LDGAHAATRARGKRAGPPRRSGTALRLQPRRPATNRKAIGAETSRRHLLRWIGRASGGRAPWRRGCACHRGRTGPDRGLGRESEKGEQAMNPLAEIILKVSLILAVALVIAAGLRAQSAALRHWVLAVGV